MSKVTLYEVVGRAVGHEVGLEGYDVTTVDEIEYDASEMSPGEALEDAGYRRNWIEGNGRVRAYSGHQVRYIGVVETSNSAVDWSEA